LISDPVLVNDWHVVARSEDLKEGTTLPARLLEEDLVLWRSGGKAIAWQDLCIHRGARLTLGSVKDGLLSCRYHGWTYDPDGKCVRIPAHPDQKPPERAQVKPYRVTEKYGLVWVSLGNPEKDIPVFPEWDDLSYRALFANKSSWNADGPRIIESALDVAHFPFVHPGLLGEPDKPEVNDYEVTTGPEGIRATNIRMWQPTDLAGVPQGEYVTYEYRILRPLTMYLSTEWDDKRRLAFFMSVTPVEKGKSMVWVLIAVNHLRDVPENELQNYQTMINDQDIPVVESQRPELLPLDLQAELHLRSDRTSIAYRKWLKQLALTFGTA
jgi:phenylpropionate dioxygenase-like ring-hydroxylating dioxygenase large terminal subunit